MEDSAPPAPAAEAGGAEERQGSRIPAKGAAGAGRAAATAKAGLVTEGSDGPAALPVPRLPARIPSPRRPDPSVREVTAPEAAGSPGPAPSAPALPASKLDGLPRLSDLLTEPGWREALRGEFSKPYFKELERFVLSEWARGSPAVFPPRPQLFAALEACPLASVRCVILGQDPYHAPGQATGLSFSVPRGTPVPSSLRNIHKELAADLGLVPPGHGNLEAWARRGVLLLNASLTVRAGQAASHAGKGWERFTDAVVRAVVDRRGCETAAAAARGAAVGAEAGEGRAAPGDGPASPRAPPRPLAPGPPSAAADPPGSRSGPTRPCCVFLLWGRHAQKKGMVIFERVPKASRAPARRVTIGPSVYEDHEAPGLLALSSAHPSGLSASRGFFGCRHFSRTNEWLVAHGAGPIDWRLD